jgi:uncharacterized MAPEG superfamily protein
VVPQRLTETLDAGEILYRSTSSCAPTLWVDRVRGPHYLKSARFVRRSLERLYRIGSPIRAQATDTQPLPPGPITRRPGNLRAAAVLGQMAVRTALANTRHLCRHDIWSIVLRQARPLLAPSAAPPPVVARIAGRGWQTADPCLFTWEERLYCFFERVPIGRQRGEIAVVRVLEDGRLTEPQSVLTAAQLGVDPAAAPVPPAEPPILTSRRQVIARYGGPVGVVRAALANFHLAMLCFAVLAILDLMIGPWRIAETPLDLKTLFLLLYLPLYLMHVADHFVFLWRGGFVARPAALLRRLARWNA